MDTIIKAVSGIFFALILVYLSFGLLTTTMNAMNADSALANYVDRIENSNFSPDVIDACKQNAEDEFGPNALNIDLVKQAGCNYKVSYGTASLKYKFIVPLLGTRMSKEHYVYADLR